MKKKFLHRRSLLFALCLAGCLQTMPLTATDSFQFPFLKTLDKERVMAKAPMLAYDDDEDEKEKALVTPPTGLVTEAYTLVSVMMTSDDTGEGYAALLGKEDHMQALQIGFQGPDVYIQGLCTNFPNAWVKGVLNEDETAVEFPELQYIGSLINKDGKTEDWVFVGYPFSFDKQSRSFTTSPMMETGFYEENNYGYRVINLIPQIVKSVPAEELVTPPGGLVTKDYLLSGSSLGTGTDNLLLKVGFYGNDVYIQGLCPLLPDAWVKGTLSGSQIIFPKWQFLGESEEVTRALQEALEKQGIDVPVVRKKTFLYSLNVETYAIDDVVLQYDKDSGNMTMTDGMMILGLSRVFPELAFGIYQNILISPITEKSATPSAPSISAFSAVDNGYCLAFSVPVVDEEGSGMLPDKLYYRILTENDGQASALTFKPADYETLQNTLSLIPYGFTDGTYFTAPLNMTTGKVEKNVLLKGTLFTSLNKVGVQSVYQGGGTTNESEVVWFTIYEAGELLRSEIYMAQYYMNDSSKPFGKNELQTVLDRAKEIKYVIDHFDGDELEDADILPILSIIQQLKTAEAAFLELNANVSADIMLTLLETEISQAYELYNDDRKPNGKDELLEAICQAEAFRNELVSMDEEELKEFDMNVILNEIEVLKQAEQTYRELNNPADDYIPELEEEISNAYDLYDDDDLEYDKDVLMDAICSAQELYNKVCNMSEEALFNFDFSAIADEISMLRAAEEAFFTINTIVSEDEWQTLKTYCQSSNAGEWTKKWDFSSSTRSRKALPGVKSYDGHVLNIDLRSNNVAGAFPYSFLNLPHLKELDLSGNQLSGDIGEGMTQFLKTANASSSIKSLDISNNQLSGNIGTIANALTGLEQLYAYENRLDEVTPVIPNTVMTLDLDNQTIQKEVDLHLSDVAASTMLQSIPNILLYNHNEQAYENELYIEFKDDQGTTINMTFHDGAAEVSGGYNYAYKGESGDQLNATTPWGWSTPGGISLPIRLYFGQGDADFNGRIDILDLQTQIDYIVDEYIGAINFTAANLWKDEILNVQDAVCMVNLLLDKNPATGNAKRQLRQKERSQTDVASQVFISGGRLFINTTQPVAAFDIVVASDNALTLSSELTKHGMTCTMRYADGQMHLIGYSLNGGTLPEGLTEIGRGANGEVAYAMCAGRDAREIPVAMNLFPTDIAKLTSDTNPDDVRYILPLDTKHTIYIDVNGKKTLHKNTK